MNYSDLTIINLLTAVDFVQLCIAVYTWIFIIY